MIKYICIKKYCSVIHDLLKNVGDVISFTEDYDFEDCGINEILAECYVPLSQYRDNRINDILDI